MTINKIDSSKSTKLKITSNQKDISSSFYKSFKKVNDLKDKIEEGSLVFDYGGRLIRAKPVDIIRVISQSKKSNSLDLCTKNIILNSLITMESRAPFSSHAFLDSLKEQPVSKWKTKLRVEPHEMLYLVKKSLGDGICYEIFKTIFENASLFGTVEFKVSKEKQSFEVHSSGGKSYEGQLPMLWNEKVNNLENSKIIFIDGIIEKISEIHLLLETSSLSKSPLIIMARGFGADVVHTLSENYKTKKLNVVPFQVLEEEVKLVENEIYSIKSDNYRDIFKTSFEDIDNMSHVTIKKNALIILNGSKDELSSSVIVPQRYLDHIALIEDRINSSIVYARNISKFGLILNELNRPVYGRKQYEIAIKTSKKIKELIENLGCVVIHSV